MSIVNWVLENYEKVLVNSQLILGGIIGVSMLIPGDQPEKALKSIASFIEKFSKK